MVYESKAGIKMGDKDYIRVLIYAFLGDIAIICVVVVIALFSLGIL